MSIIEQISPSILGERLRMAREEKNYTQAAAAKEMKMSRTTLVAIEQGIRKLRLEELFEIAKLYGTSINTFLRREAIHVDLIPRFRKDSNFKSPDVETAAHIFNNLVKTEVELESLLGIKRVRNYPQERPILSGDVQAQAEQDALELRQWLGLGLSPVNDLVSLLELQLGVRVYIRRLPGKISGLFVYDEAIGACILLNASHPQERRTQSAAHELGHLVSVRSKSEVLEDGNQETRREELYATAFARSFLTPARTVTLKFKEITAGATSLTRRHIILLAYTFGVSREAMARRLEELRLTKVGTWEWFDENGGITDEHAKQVLGNHYIIDQNKIDASRPVSLRLGLMIEEAWKKDILSEGQLAQLLQMDRIDVRKLLDDLVVEEIEEVVDAPNIF